MHICVIFRPAVFATLLMVVTAACVYAQGTGASITGTVKDPSGAVIAGSSVQAMSVESGRELTTVSNEAGIYNLTALPLGQYTVSVEAAGFKRAVTNMITLDVNQVARVDLTLEVGAIADTVAVTGVAPLLDTETSQLGSVVTGST